MKNALFIFFVLFGLGLAAMGLWHVLGLSEYFTKADGLDHCSQLARAANSVRICLL